MGNHLLPLQQRFMDDVGLSGKDWTDMIPHNLMVGYFWASQGQNRPYCREKNLKNRIFDKNVDNIGKGTKFHAIHDVLTYMV